jgi:hypothetical protein
MGYVELAAELQKPAYTSLTDVTAASTLNAAIVAVERTIVPAYELWEAIVPSEWSAATAAERTRVQVLLSMGNVNLKGANTRASLAAAFGAGTTTRTNLVALQSRTTSLADALGFPGGVQAWQVAKARRL